MGVGKARPVGGGDTMSEELKPCPFCGDTPHLMDDPTDGGKRFWWTECRECGALNAYFRTKGEAVAAWNRREPDWQELAREMATAIAKLRAANASTVMDPRYTYVRSSRVLMDAYVDLAGVESKARKAGLLEEKHE